MVKGDLNKLIIISDEEARLSGFRCQADFYAYMIILHDNIDSANFSIQKLIIRAKVAFHYSPSVNMASLMFGDEGFEVFADINKTIADNYEQLCKEHPEFGEFLKKIENTPSMHLNQEKKEFNVLKCNLKDLYVVSDEAARYNGFFCQFDLYVCILSSIDDLDLANSELKRMEELKYPIYKYGISSLNERVIRGGYDSIYSSVKFAAKNVLERCEAVIQEYPDFNDYILSISNAPSKANLNRFDIPDDFKRKIANNKRFTDKPSN